MPARPAASEAAAVSASILALLAALRLIPPAPVALMEFSLLILASTSSVIVFWARATPIEIDTPAVPPNAAARVAAPATVRTVEALVALSAMLAAVTVPVPSM